MKNLKFLIAGFLLTITVGVVFGAKITDDTLKMCVPGTADACFIVFDTDDGASNISLEANSGNLKINNGPLTASSITASDIDLGTATDASRITMGKGNSAALSALARKEGTLHYDTDQSNLVFDDGSDLRPVGSGSGSGTGVTNLVANPTFDINVNSWTQSGGTLTQETSSPVGNGTGSARWTPTTSGETLVPDAVVIPDVLNEAACLAQFQYRYAGGADGDIKVRAKEGANFLTDELLLPLTPGTSEWRKVQIGFTCPTGTSPIIEIETVSGSPQPFFLDDVQIGTDTRIGVTPGTNGPWTSYTPSVPNNVTGTLEEAFYKHVGKTLTIHAKFDITGAWVGALQWTTAQYLPTGFTLNTSIVDSATADKKFSCNGGAAGRDDSAASGADDVGGLVHFLNDGRIVVTGATLTEDLWASNSPFSWANLDVLAVTCDVPVNEGNTSDQTVTLGNQEWHIDANIGGANPSLGLAAVTTYASITNTGLDMVLNAGSAPAKIPCLTTTPSEGLTCNSAGVAEALGVAFTPEATGEHKICFSFTHSISVDDNTEDVLATFQIIETQINDDTVILQLGKVRVQSGHRSAAGTAGTNQSVRQSHHLCGYFNVSVISEKVFRLQFEQSVSGSPDSSDINMDRSATLGDRDMHVRVDRITREFNNAVALVAGKLDITGVTCTGTTGGTVDIVGRKIDGLVTITSTFNMGTSSGSDVICAAALPSDWRPTTGDLSAFAGFTTGADSHKYMEVTTAGAVNTFRRVFVDAADAFQGLNHADSVSHSATTSYIIP